MSSALNPEAWRRLEAEALELLKHADKSTLGEPIRGRALVLRLWRYSRRGPFQSWSIIAPVREYRVRSAVVREATWDRVADWKRAKTPLSDRTLGPRFTPSLHLRDAPMEWALLGPLLDEAGRLPMGDPSDPPATGPVEETSGLEGHRFLSHVRFEWTGKGPRQWQSAIAWFEGFRKVLLRVMKAGSAGA